MSLTSRSAHWAALVIVSDCSCFMIESVRVMLHGGCHFSDVSISEMATTFAIAFLFLTKANADGNLRAVEELVGGGDHSVCEIGRDEAHNRVLFLFD